MVRERQKLLGRSLIRRALSVKHICPYSGCAVVRDEAQPHKSPRRTKHTTKDSQARESFIYLSDL